VAVAVTERHANAESVFERAIQVDLDCITAPWLLPTGGWVYDRNIALVVLYANAAVMAYGVVDLPFTYAAYSIHRASR